MNAVPTLCLAAAFAALVPAAAHARVERYAVVVGNNAGASGETTLLYAESDAARVHDVLHDLGEFAPVNLVLLRGESADTVRSTLIALNDRIRDAMSDPDTQVVLFVYYSGHADAEALHLGRSRLGITELAQLVRGSAASFRLVVLDACRSGALTRLKGGRVVAPFPLPDDRLPSDGLAYLTASSESEDAQESDELRGSFFTHAFVSGLLGAADRNRDGAVVLDEAYRYAYENTLRATSRTQAGTQHPTFRYDLRGKGELVLTRPEAYAHTRAELSFPEQLGFLLMRDHEDGVVIAELAQRSAQRMLSVRPGRYFVRARGADVLYEGEFDAPAGVRTTIELAQLRRIEYARLVRKGGGRTPAAHGPEAGARVRSPLSNADGPCFGAFAGYRVDLEAFGIATRASACTSELESPTLSATVNVFDFEVRLYRAWDFAALSLGPGLGGGLSLFTQRFHTAGVAPDRDTLAPFLSLSFGAALDFGSGFELAADIAAETHFIPLSRERGREEHLNVAFAARAGLSFGKHL